MILLARNIKCMHMHGGSIGGGGVKYNKWKRLVDLQRGKVVKYPLLSQERPERVKLGTLNFVCTFIISIRFDRNKTPGIKMSGKVAVGVLRDSRKFSGHPYIGHIGRSSLW